MGRGGHVLDEMDTAAEHMEGAVGAAEISRIVGGDGPGPEDRHRIPGVGGDDVGPVDDPWAGQVKAAAVVGVVGVVAVLREGVFIYCALADVRPEAVQQADIEDVDRVVTDVPVNLDLVSSAGPGQEAAYHEDKTAGERAAKVTSWH